jgi:hypothetical protein
MFPEQPMIKISIRIAIPANLLMFMDSSFHSGGCILANSLTSLKHLNSTKLEFKGY